METPLQAPENWKRCLRKMPLLISEVCVELFLTLSAKIRSSEQQGR